MSDDVLPPGDTVPPPTPNARTYRSAGVTVVELSGEIDLGSAEQVDPHLAAAVRGSGPPRVVLDLGRLEFVDCYGLSLLVRTRRRVRDRGGRLWMCCDHPQARKLLRLTGLDELFHPYRTLADALRESARDAAGEGPPE